MEGLPPPPASATGSVPPLRLAELKSESSAPAPASAVRLSAFAPAPAPAPASAHAPLGTNHTVGAPVGRVAATTAVAVGSGLSATMPAPPTSGPPPPPPSHSVGSRHV